MGAISLLRAGRRPVALAEGARDRSYVEMFFHVECYSIYLTLPRSECNLSTPERREDDGNAS